MKANANMQNINIFFIGVIGSKDFFILYTYICFKDLIIKNKIKKTRYRAFIDLSCLYYSPSVIVFL